VGGEQEHSPVVPAGSGGTDQQAGEGVPRGSTGQEFAFPSWLVAVKDRCSRVRSRRWERDRVHVESERVKSDRIKSDEAESEYLVERNSGQIFPGALSIHSASGKPGASGRMVAVRDPVYTMADTRWKTTGSHALKEGSRRRKVSRDGWRLGFDMIRADGRRSRPAYGAASQVTGGRR